MTKQRRTCRHLHGWRFLFFAAAAIVAAGWWNDRVARSAPLQPPHPKNAAWTFSTSDFPGFWNRLETGDVAQRMASDWPRPQSAMELAGRKSTGIRPTPSRWRLWLGYRLAVSRTADGIGISAHPGWLLRAADIALRLATSNRDPDGVSRYGDWHYGWRDGFLVASKSRAYVAECLAHPDPSPLRCRDDGVPVVEWGGPSEGYVRLLPGDGIPVEGSITVALSDGTTPLTLSRAWPETPLASITARDWESLRAVGMLLSHSVEQTTYLETAAPVATVFADTWSLVAQALQMPSGANQISLALCDVDTSHVLPVPSVAIAMRGAGLGADAIEDALPLRQTIPYEWNGLQGSMTPLLGQNLSLYVCSSDTDRLVSNSEVTMAGLAGRLALGPAENGDIDLAIAVDWKKLSASLDEMAAIAGELQLLPRMNIDDVRHTIQPKLKGLSELGMMSLTGRVEQGQLVFSGHVFKSDGAIKP